MSTITCKCGREASEIVDGACGKCAAILRVDGFEWFLDRIPDELVSERIWLSRQYAEALRELAAIEAEGE